MGVIAVSLIQHGLSSGFDKMINTKQSEQHLSRWAQEPPVAMCQCHLSSWARVSDVVMTSNHSSLFHIYSEQCRKGLGWVSSWLRFFLGAFISLHLKFPNWSKSSSINGAPVVSLQGWVRRRDLEAGEALVITVPVTWIIGKWGLTSDIGNVSSSLTTVCQAKTTWKKVYTVWGRLQAHKKSIWFT